MNFKTSLKFNKNIFYLLLWVFTFSLQATQVTGWSDTELTMLRLQSIKNLPELPPDPSNKYADNADAARLGHKLFFDKRLSSNGKVACVSCHQVAKNFTDGLAKSKGIGETGRSAPSIVGIAYSPWFFWDGRSDSLWSQALGPLESGVEHGGNRSQLAKIIYNDLSYKKMYEKVFGILPDLSDIKRFPDNAAPIGIRKSDEDWYAMSDEDRKIITRIFVNISKSIAAYERLIVPGPARFDNYVDALEKNELARANKILSVDEIAGLKLFIGKAMCVTCHQGPLFTHHGFHNTGSPDPASIRPKITIQYMAKKNKPSLDQGRFKGILLALKSEFNCLGEYSDAAEGDCSELKFANRKRDETLGAFKVPTLRNIVETSPYMHAGQLDNLKEVIKHYNTIPIAPIGHTDLLPVKLSDKELKQIESFLHSLSGPLAVAPELLRAPGS